MKFSTAPKLTAKPNFNDSHSRFIQPTLQQNEVILQTNSHSTRPLFVSHAIRCKQRQITPTTVNTMFYDGNLLMRRTNSFLRKGKCTYRSTPKDQGSTVIESLVLCKDHKYKEIKYSSFKIVVQRTSLSAAAQLQAHNFIWLLCKRPVPWKIRIN